MYRIPLALCLTVLAAPGSADASDELQFGLDVIVERQHQDFGDISANVDTVALQPHLFFSNWDFNIYLPWQRADGEYFVNGFQPQATYLCQRLNSLSPARLRLLQRHGRIDTTLGNFCSSEGSAPSTADHSESGAGDVSAAAHYNIALDTAGFWLASFGIAYKWDNGDPDTGIGSGTREPSVDVSIGFENDRWRTTAAGGYALVYPGSSEEDLDNYAFASLDAAWKTLGWLTLGANYKFEQSNIPDTDDIGSIALYIELVPANYLRFIIEARDYLDVDGFPDHEYTGRLVATF